MYLPIGDLIQNFRDLFGRRNSFFLPNILYRIGFLALGIKDFQDAIRKGENKFVLGATAARIFSRLCCVIDQFAWLPVPQALGKKYGMTECHYCRHLPCDCPEKRPEVYLNQDTASACLRWGLVEWTAHLDKIYGTKNRQRGIENVLNRLSAESNELLSLGMMISMPSAADVTTFTMQEFEQEIAKECADVIAWLIAA